MTLEYLAIVAFLYGCGINPDGGPWPPNPRTDPSVFDKFIGNIYYTSLAGLIVTTVATHPEEAFSARYGGFILIPAIRVIAALYYNNTSVSAATKAKGG
jgi:hypothetical protein